MEDGQSKGRKDNGAMPGGKPEAATSDKAVRETGRRETKSAGPDGPDASAVGDTFKR